MGQRNGTRAVASGILMLVLAGCMNGGNADDGIVSRFKAGPLGTEATGKRTEKRTGEKQESVIIATLQERRSVLPSGSSFDKVAGPVLSANARAAESELRSARLRAEAQSKNWLPTLGPNISLSSLGDLVATMVIDAVLFDNGRKKAEREFARADVEVAAVNLAIDSNDRVYTALELYLRAQQARETATHLEASLKDMRHFEWVMNERVKGGVSDMSDLHVIRHKLSKIQADLSAQNELAASAMAELNAMSVKKLNGIGGLSDIRVTRHDAQALTVLLAEAEKERSITGAKIDRAGHLPGLGATATLAKGGNVTAGLATRMDTPFGFGTKASLQAIEAEKEAAGRRVNQAQEDANRSLAKAETRLAALSRQVGESSNLSAQAKSNLDLFQTQYDAGQRQVMDVVGVYETWSVQEQSRIGLKYDMALTRLDMARELGLLADGGDI
ncbi:MAG: transporter [Rhodobacterales bacterium]|nr:MAG: transporter [Rhodobacterales bacterium]